MQSSAVYSRTVPRRSRLPNRMDPWDCSLCAAQLRTFWGRLTTKLLSFFYGSRLVPRILVVGGHRICILETRGSYATRLWYSSTVLSEWLYSNRRQLGKGTVLEVGAGTGLCSLLLAATSDAHVIATDYDEEGLGLLQQSANEQSLPIRTLYFDICSDDSLPECDCLVASDMM